MIHYGSRHLGSGCHDRGLITPIVRQRRLKGLAQIASEMKDIAAARQIGSSS